MQDTHIKRRGRPAVVALVLVALGVVALSFVPGFRASAALFWISGFALMIAALVLALKPDKTAPERPDRRSLWVVTVAVAAAAAVAAAGVVHRTDSISTALPETVSLPDQVTSVQVGSLSTAETTVTPNLGEEAVTALVTDAASVREGFVVVPDAQASALVDQVREAGFVPSSGLTADYGSAVVEAYQRTTFVTVPLLGTDLPEVTKATFALIDGQASVVEMSASMIDAHSVSFQMWQDGTLVKNVTLVNPDAVGIDTGGVIQTGLDWSRLNWCLNNIGISWAVLAVISVACAAACATAVACAPCIAAMAGWTGGSIGACVEYAWT